MSLSPPVSVAWLAQENTNTQAITVNANDNKQADIFLWYLILQKYLFICTKTKNKSLLIKNKENFKFQQKTPTIQ